MIYTYLYEHNCDNYLHDYEPQFFKDELIFFTTGKKAICVDLTNGKEIFNVRSEGSHTAYALEKPIIFKDKIVYLDDLELSTYHDAEQT